MNENDVIDFINTNAYNMNYPYDKSEFTITSDYFPMMYGACATGTHYIVIGKQDTWLLSKCINGCGGCRACTKGVWVEQTSGLICYL